MDYNNNNDGYLLGSIGGIYCSHLGAGRFSPKVVSGIQLQSNNLKGTIPDELGTVLASNLQALQLSQNSLYGTLPSTIGKLTDLRILDIGNNLLSGILPSTLGLIRRIEVFRLNQNNFEGDFAMVFSLAVSFWEKLRIFDISNNIGFTGRFFNKKGETRRLRNLISVDISNCSFTGQLISLPPSIEVFNADNNYFVGNVPLSDEDYGGFPQTLSMFTVRNNQFTGAITPLIGNACSRLSVLDLSQNQLSSKIPSELGKCSNLQKLILHDNLISGTVPGELSSLSSLRKSVFQSQLSHWPLYLRLCVSP